MGNVLCCMMCPLSVNALLPCLNKRTVAVYVSRHQARCYRLNVDKCLLHSFICLPRLELEH
jgi:hypothetical protein